MWNGRAGLLLLAEAARPMPAAVDFLSSFGNQERSTCGNGFFNEPEPILHCIHPSHSGGERSPPVPDHETYQGEHSGERHAESPQHKLSEFGKPCGQIVEALFDAFESLVNGSKALVDPPLYIADPPTEGLLSFFQPGQPLDDFSIGDPGGFLESLCGGYGKQQEMEQSDPENSFHNADPFS